MRTTSFSFLSLKASKWPEVFRSEQLTELFFAAADLLLLDVGEFIGHLEEIPGQELW